MKNIIFIVIALILLLACQRKKITSPEIKTLSNLSGFIYELVEQYDSSLRNYYSDTTGIGDVRITIYNDTTYTDSAGNFTLNNISEGIKTLRIFHDYYNPMDTMINVEQDKYLKIKLDAFMIDYLHLNDMKNEIYNIYSKHGENSAGSFVENKGTMELTVNSVNDTIFNVNVLLNIICITYQGWTFEPDTSFIENLPGTFNIGIDKNRVFIEDIDFDNYKYNTLAIFGQFLQLYKLHQKYPMYSNDNIILSYTEPGYPSAIIELNKDEGIRRIYYWDHWTSYPWYSELEITKNE